MLPRSLVLLALCACAAPPPAPPAGDRITILYDAFGRRSDLVMDWGFAALVEIGGRRILFDTGNNSDTFARNAAALAVDLARLDFAVVSHRHGDHTDGLRHLLRVNPGVTIHAPADLYFGGPTPPALFRRGVESLPPDSRYFGGKPPEQVPHGTPWAGAKIVRVGTPTEVAPGVHLIPTTSQVPGTLEMPELSLAVKTPEGLILVCGCSHPGVEKIVEAAAAIDPRIRLIVGGLHLAPAPEAQIESTVAALRDRWKVAFIAPGHCTGEPAFAAFRKAFADRCLYAGLGTTLPLP